MTPNALPPAPVIGPAGYLQLASMTALFAAAALRLPAQHLTFLGTSVNFTIISCEGGRFVFFGAIGATILAIIQLLLLQRMRPATLRYRLALILCGAGTCIGFAIAALGVRIGFFPDIPEEMEPAPGVASLIVILAGVVYASLAALRVAKLRALRRAG